MNSSSTQTYKFILPPLIPFQALSKNCEKRLSAASCSSVRLTVCNNSALTGEHFMTFDIYVFFENLMRKFKFRLNPTRTMNTLHGYLCTFMISRGIILRMRNVSDRFVEEIKKHILCSVIVPENRPVFWDKVEKHLEANKQQFTVGLLRVTCLITKNTDTYSECVVRISLQLQQWLLERAFLLRLYVHCLYEG